MRLVQGMALGDSILLSGAVVYLSRIWGPIRVVCSPEWEISVRNIYMDQSDIHVYSYVTEMDTHQDIPKLIGPFGIIETLDSGGPEEWYKQLGIPFFYRWYACPIRKLCEYINPSKEELVFVHDDRDRGFKIPVKGYRPLKTESILEHIPILKSAKEIHCMESAFFHLIESMPRLGVKLFLHRSVKAGYGLPMRQNWTVV